MVEDVRADRRVLLHGLELLGREPPRFQQDRVVDPDFADVVQRACPIDVLQELLVDLLGVGAAATEFFGDDLGVGAHPDEMLARLRVAQLGHFGQGRDRHVVDVRHELGAGRVRFAAASSRQAVTAGQGDRLQGAAKAEMEPDPGAHSCGSNGFTT